MSWSYGMSRHNWVICSKKWLQYTFLWKNEFHPELRLFFRFRKSQIIHTHSLSVVIWLNILGSQNTVNFRSEPLVSHSVRIPAGERKKKKAAWIIHANLNKISSLNLWLLLFVYNLSLTEIACWWYIVSGQPQTLLLLPLSFSLFPSQVCPQDDRNVCCS